MQIINDALEGSATDEDDYGDMDPTTTTISAATMTGIPPAGGTVFGFGQPLPPSLFTAASELTQAVGTQRADETVVVIYWLECVGCVVVHSMMRIYNETITSVVMTQVTAATITGIHRYSEVTVCACAYIHTCIHVVATVAVVKIIHGLMLPQLRNCTLRHGPSWQYHREFAIKYLIG
jgi:hypothetical protein